MATCEIQQEIMKRAAPPLSAVCQNSTKSSKDIRVTERSLMAWTCLQAYSSPAATSTLNLTCDSYTRKAAVNLVFRGPGINWRFWGGFARRSVSNLKVLSFFCVILNVKLRIFCQKTQLWNVCCAYFSVSLLLTVGWIWMWRGLFKDRYWNVKIS